MVVTVKDLDPFVELHPGMGPYEADMGRGRESLALKPKGTTVTYRATPTAGQLRIGGTGSAGGQPKRFTAHHVERNFPREGGLPMHEEGVTHQPYRTRQETFDRVNYLDVKPVMGKPEWPARQLFPYNPTVKEVEAIEHDIELPQTTKFTGGGYSVLDLADIDISAREAERGAFGALDPDIGSSVMPGRKVGLRDIDESAYEAQAEALSDIDETAMEAEAEALSDFHAEEMQLTNLGRRMWGRRRGRGRMVQALDSETTADLNREVGHFTDLITKVAKKAATQVLDNAGKGKYRNYNHARNAAIRRVLTVTRNFNNRIRSVAVQAAHVAVNTVKDKISAAIRGPKATKARVPKPTSVTVKEKKAKLGWVGDLVTALRKKGWNDSQIKAYVYRVGRLKQRGIRRKGLGENPLAAFLTEQDLEYGTVHLGEGTVSAFVTAQDMQKGTVHLGDFGHIRAHSRPAWSRGWRGQTWKWRRGLGDHEDLEAALSHIKEKVSKTMEGMGQLDPLKFEPIKVAVTGTIVEEVTKAAEEEGKSVLEKAKEPSTSDWIKTAIGFATDFAGGYFASKTEAAKAKAEEAKVAAAREERRAGMTPAERAIDVLAPPDVPFYARPLFIGGAVAALAGLAYIAFKPSDGGKRRARPRRRRRR